MGSKQQWCAMLWLCAALSGCEYEFKEEAGGGNISLVAPPADEERSVEEQKKPEQAERPVLVPGQTVSGMDAVPDQAKRLNLPELVESGALKVSSNIPSSNEVGKVYDEMDTSLARSEGINPFKVTFEFNGERSIRAVKVLSTYSDYAWALQFENGERLMVESVADGDWSTMAFPQGVKARKFTVEVLRKVRDNYVHLNEIEVYE